MLTSIPTITCETFKYFSLIKQCNILTQVKHLQECDECPQWYNEIRPSLMVDRDYIANIIIEREKKLEITEISCKELREHLLLKKDFMPESQIHHLMTCPHCLGWYKTVGLKIDKDPDKLMDYFLMRKKR